MTALLDMLAAETGLSDSDLRSIIRTAPSRYKTYNITKRNGGLRAISQPARELKTLQRILVSAILSRLPVHSAAMAYRSNQSIRDNALAHVSNGPILKFDFKDFFPSIVAADWETYCLKAAVFKDLEDIKISSRILFHRRGRGTVLRLAIGAPSSPMLSNVLMCAFDKTIAEAVAREHVSYTRYADDLTFSARRTGYLNGVERILRGVIKEMSSPSLVINEEKTVMATTKYRRIVTGLILTNDGKVSIGHERKRAIRAAMDYAKRGRLTVAEQTQLSGFLAFIKDVEPELFSKLVGRYGMDLITQIRAAISPSRYGFFDGDGEER